MHKQHTLNHEVLFQGIGVHSGLATSVLLKPASPNTGVIIQNSADYNQKILVGTIVPEHAMHATVIKQDNWHVSTIEHLMAALSVLGVDNVVIEVTGSEIPILDGSALPFVQKLLEIGLCEQEFEKKMLTPKETITFQDASGRLIELSPAGVLESGLRDKRLLVEYQADFNHPLAGGTKLSEEVTLDCFVAWIAPARTFGFLDQLPFLRQHGLARGTSLGNTVVIGQEELLNDMRLNDECVRHKFLDLLGDLSLLGKNLAGSIKAYKTGHSFNRLVIQHYINNKNLWELI